MIFLAYIDFTLFSFISFIYCFLLMCFDSRSPFPPHFAHNILKQSIMIVWTREELLIYILSYYADMFNDLW